jgi:hypothetical protein
MGDRVKGEECAQNLWIAGNAGQVMVKRSCRNEQIHIVSCCWTFFFVEKEQSQKGRFLRQAKEKGSQA